MFLAQLLDERGGSGFLTLPRRASPRTRTPRRSLTISPRHPVRRLYASPGDRTDDELMVREVPPRNDTVASGVDAAVGTSRDACQDTRLVRHRRTCRPRHSTPPGFRRHPLDEDDRPFRQRSAV